MTGFREFFTEQSKEQEENVKATLKKLPLAYQKLVAGYKIKWHNDNTLQGDDEHIGIVNPKTKTITIAAPYNYGREFTLLHEIAHKVWEHFITKELLGEWEKIVKKTKNKMKQSAEELWCMGFANHFARNKIVIHTHPEWETFMKKFIKMTS